MKMKMKTKTKTIIERARDVPMMHALCLRFSKFSFIFQRNIYDIFAPIMSPPPPSALVAFCGAETDGDDQMFEVWM